MTIITHQRDKCIGCNSCVELSFANWRMNVKDGKSTLIGSKNKKGFHTLHTDDFAFDDNAKAAEACPVNIIKVSKA